MSTKKKTPAKPDLSHEAHEIGERLEALCSLAGRIPESEDPIYPFLSDIRDRFNALYERQWRKS